MPQSDCVYLQSNLSTKKKLEVDPWIPGLMFSYLKPTDKKVYMQIY